MTVLLWFAVVAVLAGGMFAAGGALDLWDLLRGRQQRELDFLADAYRWRNGYISSPALVNVPCPARSTTAAVVAFFGPYLPDPSSVVGGSSCVAASPCSVSGPDTCVSSSAACVVGKPARQVGQLSPPPAGVSA